MKLNLEKKMKISIKTQLLLSVCLLSLYSHSAISQGPDGDEAQTQQPATKLRKVEIQGNEGGNQATTVVAAPKDKAAQFHEEVRSIYDKEKSKGIIKLEEGKIAFAYMIRPEAEGADPEVGHAVLAIIGGNETFDEALGVKRETPYFWAADFVKSDGTFNANNGQIFDSFEGKVNVLNSPDATSLTFFSSDQTQCRKFSMWPRKVWQLTLAEGDSLIRRVTESKDKPPLYSASGCNYNPIAQHWDTYNSSMWAQKIITAENLGKVNHMKIALGKSVPKNSFLYWLVGCNDKVINEALPSLLRETFGLIVDLIPLHKFNPANPLKIVPDIIVDLGFRVVWVVQQIPQIGTFFGAHDK